MRRALRALACAGLAIVGLALGPAAPSGAAGARGFGGVPRNDFAATASADGFRVGVAVRRFLVVEQFVDAGAPSAQAHVDSLGNSVAWAAYPFPSDLVVSVPGTVAGFGPSGLPALPEYPFYASATYPTRGSAEVGAETFALQAKAEEQAAAASARAGLVTEDVRIGVTRSAASAVRSADGIVQAVGESAVEGFTVGDVLRIGRVHSRAVAGARPGEAVSRTGETTVAEMTVAGQTVAIGPNGITSPGGATPLPDSAPARQALAEAGVSVRYLAPLETDAGVVAAGLEVQLVREVAGVGEAVVSYVLGRATASADAAPDLLAEPEGDLPVTGPGTVSPPSYEQAVAGEAASAGRDADAAAGGGSDAAALPSGPGLRLGASDAAPSGVSQPSSGPSAAGAEPGAAASPAAPAGAALVPSAPARAVVPGPDFSGFLPILVAGGAVVFGAVIAAGRVMRRASWTS